MPSEADLLKLSYLECYAQEYLDVFIKEKLKQGITVSLKTIPGHISHAHQYNLRDYIGRSLWASSEFVRKRMHCWSVGANGELSLVQYSMRRIFREAVALLNENSKKNGGKKEATLGEIMDMLRSKSLLGTLSISEVADNIMRRDNLFILPGSIFTEAENTIIGCRGVVVNNTILPDFVTTTITYGMALAMKSFPLPSSVYIPNAPAAGHRQRMAVTLENIATNLENARATIEMSLQRTAFQNSVDYYDYPDLEHEEEQEKESERPDSASGHDTGIRTYADWLKTIENGTKRDESNTGTNSVHGASDYGNRLAEIDQELEDIDYNSPSSSPNSVQYVDVGCQTDETDEAKLLRMLRACPCLLDAFEIIRGK